MILEERLSVLEDLTLHKGNGGMKAPCVMDVVDYITGGDGENDHPSCASPVITKFAIRINDASRFAEFRNELKPYIVRIAGSVGTLEQEIQRAYLVSDWAVRVIAPIALEAAGLKDEAEKLCNLSPIVDQPTAAAARAAAYAAGYAAARAAAYAAGYAAAYAAARAAAYAAYAAAYAARAGYAAAAAAAAAAARADAAADAARADADTAYAAAADDDARREIWDSSLGMLDQLIKVTEEQVA